MAKRFLCLALSLILVLGMIPIPAYAEEDPALAETAAETVFEETEPSATEEPAPETEPLQTEEPAPETEPLQTEKPVPETEPLQTEEPVPETEPVQTEEPALETEPVQTEETLPEITASMEPNVYSTDGNVAIHEENFPDEVF